MKKTLSRLLALALTAAMVLTGCSSGGDTGSNGETGSEGESSASTSDTSEDAIKDLYIPRLAQRELQTFNILYTQRAEDGENLTSLVDGLLESNPKGELVPCIAEEWGSEDGGLTWTFHLREGVKWVDMNGNEMADVTARDFATGLEWVLNFYKNDSANTSMPIEMIEGASEYYEYTKTLTQEEAYALTADDGSQFLEMVGIEIPDDYTIVYHCIDPKPYFDTVATYACMYPISQGLIDSLGVDGVKAMNNENMWYNGCYTMTSYIQGNEKVFTKNESYWDAENVNLDTITYNIMNDENAIFNSFSNASIDSCGCGTKEWMDRFNQMENVEYLHYTSPSVRFNFYNTKDELFQNKNIRNAFTLALDREDVVEVIYDGTMSPAYSWVPDGVSTGELGNFRDQMEAPLETMYAEGLDPKELLLTGMEELGLGSDPSTLEVTLSFGGTDQWMRNYGEYYQQTFKDVLGVNVVLDFNEWGTFNQKVMDGDYQMGYMAWSIDYNDPYAMLNVMRSDSGNINTGWVSEEYDSLLDQAAVEMDEAKRVELYKQAETLLFEEGPLCPVVNEAANTFRYTYIKNANTMPFTSTGLKYAYVSGR